MRTKWRAKITAWGEKTMAEQNLNARNKFAADLIEMGKELAGRGVRPDDFEPLAACARLYVLAWYCTDTTEHSLAPSAVRINTDDIDKAPSTRQASWSLEVERLRKELATATTLASDRLEEMTQLREQLIKATGERDRLRLNLASTEFPTAAAQAQPIHDQHGAR